MKKDPRPLRFVEATQTLFEYLQQQTPISAYASIMQDIQTFLTILAQAKNLLIQAEHINPMRADVRDLMEVIQKGATRLYRFFEIRQSKEYQAFIAAKREVDEFLTDPRVTAFIQKALECIELLQHLEDTSSIQTPLTELHSSLINAQAKLIYQPERAYEESFSSLVQRVTNGLARMAWEFPAFAASDVYKVFHSTAFQAGLFLVGLPFAPQGDEPDSKP